MLDWNVFSFFPLLLDLPPPPSPLCNSVDFWSMLGMERPLPLSGRQLAVFLPDLITLSPASRHRKRESVWERASEGVNFLSLSLSYTVSQVLALPVWARWEQQIIGADKLRNAAQRGNTVLEEMWPIEDCSLVLPVCHPTPPQHQHRPFPLLLSPSTL